ncbi:hypothetical protein E2C01_074400 [Portunus trituberculatus]|uniref:Uncharacterized protein n=1 Tax=Portunus trituberculatus TaxID=210409 RepID=A0A5B7IDF6_PORTR|nr:hypothetical protein [Portunus trituberculatus]
MSEGWKMYENQLFREPAVRRVDSWSVKEGRQGSRRAILFPSKLTNLQGAELKVRGADRSCRLGGRVTGYRVVRYRSGPRNADSPYQYLGA